MTNIALITIGSELLSGRIVNTNAFHIGGLLRRHGYALRQVYTIPDDPDQILSALDAALPQHQVVLISGGLGPTRDDLTKKTLAAYFGQALREDADTLAHLEARYAARKRVLNSLTRQQALVPEYCEVIPNPKGTAPGMGFSRDGHWVFAMPGVPFELFYMVEHEIIPRIQRHFSGEYFAQRVVRVSQIPESEAAARMEALEDQLPPTLSVSYLPREDGLWIELSLCCPQEQKAQSQPLLEQNALQIAQLFADKSYASSDRALPALVLDALVDRGLTLAVAESITGGSLAASLVQISGASNVFRGSVTAYATDLKISHLGLSSASIAAHGIVSEEVAAAMAEGVRQRLQADVGLATTGLAEATGTSAGHAWLGYADAQRTETQHIVLPNDRQVNIRRCVNYALQLCLKKLLSRVE